MASDPPNWSKPEVLRHLRKLAKDKPVAAQVFLDECVPTEDLERTIRDIVGKAIEKAGPTGKPAVGKVHSRAKSFSIRAHPEALEAIADSPMVKAILPSEIEDIFPKPVKVSPKEEG